MSLRDAISTCSPPAHRTVPYGRRMVAALARRVLRVSASARRAAAAYGNAFWLVPEARTLISLLVFVV